MKLFQRNGTYYVSNGKKKVSLFTDDEQTAREIYVSLVKAVVMQKLDLQVPANRVSVCTSRHSQKKQKEPVSIEAEFKDYYELCRLREFHPNTMAFKRAMLAKMLEADIRYFSDVDQSHINRFIELVSKYAPDTQRKYFTAAMAFLHASVKKGVISDRRVKMIEVPKIKSRVRDVVITDEDLNTIWSYLRENDIDFYYYLLTLYNTFSRPNEVTHLKGEDFHLAERYIDIFQNKTKKMKRVYLYKEFCTEISEWITLKGDGALFEGSKLAKEHYSFKFIALRKKLNLNQKYTLYTFRHTSITNLMNKTNDVEFVARQAGNNPEMTMKHYINRNSQHYLDMMDK